MTGLSTARREAANQQDADYTYHLAVGSHGLAQRLAQLETDKARKLNDKNAIRVKELEETIEAVERSLEWMKDQRAA